MIITMFIMVLRDLFYFFNLKNEVDEILIKGPNVKAPTNAIEVLPGHNRSNLINWTSRKQKKVIIISLKRKLLPLILSHY